MIVGGGSKYRSEVSEKERGRTRSFCGQAAYEEGGLRRMGLDKMGKNVNPQIRI